LEIKEARRKSELGLVLLPQLASSFVRKITERHPDLAAGTTSEVLPTDLVVFLW
jgi:hypothetical protein